jgi:hypothetical protein
MSDFLPIEIRHLDQTVQPLISSNLFPIVIGDENNGFETRATTLKDIFAYVDFENQDSSINTLNVVNSAIIQNFLNIGQIFEDTGHKLYVDGNVLINGSLSALSGVTSIETNVIKTSSMLLSGASGVLLTVQQPFDFPIAQFYDGTNISLHIDGESVRAGNVGIKTLTPNESFTVNGNISSNSVIYSPNSIIETISSNTLQTNYLYVNNFVNLGVNDYSLINFGNSSSKVDINGNITLNTLYSGVSTVIGNPDSDIFINGYLFTKEISSSGNIYLNTNPTDLYNISIGNENSTNFILGTNLVSGINYIDGEININSGGSDNTYINTNENAGVVYIGNSLNKTEINSNSFSVNSLLTSDYIYVNFTDYESLIGTIDDILFNNTVVFSALEINSLNPQITSLQYKVLELVEAQNINLIDDIINLGNDDFLINIKSSTLNLNSTNDLNITTLSGGNINLGGDQTSTKIEGVILQINNQNDGIEKNTYINNEDSSGHLFIGNGNNELYIKGNSVYINTDSLSTTNTFIGNSSAITTIKNLNILDGLSANVPEFFASSIIADNITTQNAFVNQISASGDIQLNGKLKYTFESTAPINITTPTSWIDIEVNGTMYKMPLYL